MIEWCPTGDACVFIPREDSRRITLLHNLADEPLFSFVKQVLFEKEQTLTHRHDDMLDIKHHFNTGSFVKDPSTYYCILHGSANVIHRGEKLCTFRYMIENSVLTPTRLTLHVATRTGVGSYTWAPLDLGVMTGLFFKSLNEGFELLKEQHVNPNFFVASTTAVETEWDVLP